MGKKIKDNERFWSLDISFALIGLFDDASRVLDNLTRLLHNCVRRKSQADELKLTDRTLILVVFLVIIAATFLSAILVGLGLFENADSDFFKWLIGTGILEIIGVVIWSYRQSFAIPATVAVNIVFRKTRQPIDLGEIIDLDESKCTYEAYDEHGIDLKKSGKLNVILSANGIWQATLPSNVTAKDYIVLRLIDKAGGKWSVRKFPLLTHSREASPE